MREPASFDVTGVMSFPRLDLEVDLNCELTRIGATETETRAYVEGLRRGGVLAFATGSDEKVETAGNVMNRHGAVEVEKVTGTEPQLPGVVRKSVDMNSALFHLPPLPTSSTWRLAGDPGWPPPLGLWVDGDELPADNSKPYFVEARSSAILLERKQEHNAQHS